MTLSGEKWKAHRSTDQERVGQLEEAVDDRDLVRDLGASQRRDQWPCWILEHLGQLSHLALE